MQGLPSLVVYSCGCTSSLVIPAGLAQPVLQLSNPASPSETYHVALTRICEAPPTYLEDPASRRPLWAQEMHTMIPFDVRTFAHANAKEFESVFGPWREKWGPMVPQCMLPDILQGRGRFFGLWQGQVYKGRRIGHLCVVDDWHEGEEVKEPTPSDTPPTS